MEITQATLLSVVGIGLITAIALQLLIKPWLTKLYSDKPWHDIALNLSATALAIILAIVGLYIADIFNEGPTIALAVVRGLVGAFLSVYGWEGYKNIRKTVGGDKQE
jgi:uncharacterized BrkB/YihY/UPF0761 family membrane protein